MKNTLKVFGLHLGFFSLVVLSFGIAYAAWDSVVAPGAQLSSSSWNTLVAKIKTIDSGFNFNNGNIGIGVTNPQYELEIQSKLGDPETFTVNKNSNGGNAFLWAGSSASVGSETSNGNKINITSTDTDRTYIEFRDNDGDSTYIDGKNENIGIGTTNPSRKLHVANLSNETVAVRLQDNDTSWFLTTTTTDGFGIHETTTSTSGSRFNIDAGGRVGIGTTNPSQKLHVNGSALATAWNTTSDKRLKTNIINLEFPLKKLENIRGVSFDWKEDGKHDIGVIAQEIEAVLPEVVTTGSTGIKSVDYAKLTPLLIEVAKEQQKQIQYLIMEVEALRD